MKKTMVVAVEFEAENFDTIKSALYLVESMSTAYDSVSANVRSVRKAPLFTDKVVHIIQKEIRRNDEE